MTLRPRTRHVAAFVAGVACTLPLTVRAQHTGAAGAGQPAHG